VNSFLLRNAVKLALTESLISLALGAVFDSTSRKQVFMKDFLAETYPAEVSVNLLSTIKTDHL
jgi:hypothetical protein